MFSRRTNWPTTLNPLARAILERSEPRRAFVDLTISNPTEVDLAWPTEFFASERDADARARYRPEPLGTEHARSAVAAYYRARGAACDFSTIWLCASTSEAFAQLLTLICDAGDTVLVPRPGYPLLDYLADLAAVELASYALIYDGAWRIDLADLRSVLDRAPRTRAILCTAPGNPAGAYLSHAELGALERLCAERELALVVDEVFSDHPLRADPERVVHALGARACLTFVLSGLSKVALLPQAKLAWGVVCGPAPAVAAALARLTLICDTFLSVSTDVQLALPRILARAPEMQARCRARVHANRGALATWVAGTALTLLDAEGGWAAILRLPALDGLDDEAWALHLLERGDVLVHPGGLFGLDGVHVVVSLLCEPEPFSRGIEALVRAVEQALD